MSDDRTVFLAVMVVALTGCASTGIIQTGGDRYIVSKTSLQVGFGPPIGVYAEISQEANDFCARQNKNVEIVNTALTHPSLGSPGSATLEFRCKAKEQ